MNLLASLFLSFFLFGFTFNPMSQSLRLEEGKKSAQFMLVNNSSENMAIDLSVKSRQMNEKGEETLKETDELSIFPPQLIIPAQEKRTIRVNWNGPKDIKVEKAFRVIAEQLPLKVDEKTKKQSGIQMLMKYMAAFYVTPKEAESNLKIESTQLDGKNLSIVIENKGNKHQILTSPIIKIGSGEKEVTLKGKELSKLSGQNVLAQSRRIFLIETQHKSLPKGDASLKLDD